MSIRVSIITVCYNSGGSIRNTIESVLNQIYPNIEYIIIDGASTDNTMQIISQYGNRIARVVSESDDGIYDAINKGVQRATGEIVGILNSDDFYVHANVINEVAAAFAIDSALDVVFGDVDFVKSSDLVNPVRTYRASNFKTWMFLFGFMPPHPAVFVKKSAYERVGFYKLGYKIAADFDFLLRLLMIDGAKYHATGRHWVRMLTGGASTAGWRSNFVITKEMHRSLKENKVFSFIPMLLLRLPLKLFSQIIL